MALARGVPALPKTLGICSSCLHRQLATPPQARQVSYSATRSSHLSWTSPQQTCPPPRAPRRPRARTGSSPATPPNQRHFHSSKLTPQAQRGPDEQGQAVPLGDFYTDLLASPIPRPSDTHPHTYDSAATDTPPPSTPSDSSTTTGSPDTLPTFVRLHTHGDQSKEARAALLFGTIEGSGYRRSNTALSDTPDSTWRTINGVPVPPRPAAPDNCCMSGCVHCVWDDYRDDVEEWAARVMRAKASGPEGGRSPAAPNTVMARPELGDAADSMDDDGGGSEALWSSASPGAEDGDDLFGAIPVGIREFMATEKRIRKRKKMEKTGHGPGELGHD